MPDSFGLTGLQTKTLAELIAELETGYADIYGSDINLDPNSPDGQLLNILAQEGVDLRELLSLINAGFDPDQAEGVILDQRVGINGIERAGGTYTQITVSVVVNGAGTLVGLDSQSNELTPNVPNLYTAKDDAGNQYYLLDTQTPSGAGTNNYTFRAAAIGAVEVPANTITTPVTVLGFVTSINNPSPASLVGVNEETDTALKIRRKKSIALSSEGLIESVEAGLLNLDGVVEAFVYENTTNSTDSNGVPGHSIWAIVDGGADADIAGVLYSKRSLGAGMHGTQTYNITRPNGQIFTAKWDIPTGVNLWIRFTLALPGGVIDDDFIKEQIVQNVVWGVGEDAVNDVITTFVKSINSNYRVTSVELSDDNVTFTEIVDSPSPDSRFENAVSRILIT